MPVNNLISFEIEKKLLQEGYKIIAGIDEAGRGALAGPLYTGIVIYNSSCIKKPHSDLQSGIKDSKQLTPAKRQSALNLIHYHAEYVNTAGIWPDFIDSNNINIATEFAVRSLIKQMNPKPDVIIMDGNFKFDVGLPFIPVIKGDSRSITIASASIAAKVNRDSTMIRIDKDYPGYFFKKNMGYGTKEHINALHKSGPCPVHRKSYEPIKSMLLKTK